MITGEQKRIEAGFSLVDVLVGTGIVSTIFIGVFGAFHLGFKVANLSQNKIVAVAIANEKMEMARNLSYNLVGTTNAELPFANGVLEPEGTVIRNNIEYIVQTQVKYVIDAADGIAGEDDACPNDYKKIKVKVLWGGTFASEIFLITDIMPGNLGQECSETGGVLLILVFDAYGEMVSSPLIQIVDTDTGMTIDTAVPESGEHYFPLSAGTYRVNVFKDGYNTERTYSSDEIAFPVKPHPIVLDSKVVSISFSIDELANFSVNVFSLIDEEPIPIPNAVFFLEGEKIIGKNESEEPVPEYANDLVANEQGFLNIPDLEWDNYVFSASSGSNLSLVSSNPSPQPIGLLPGSSLEVELFLEAENSFFAVVQDQETLEPIFSAVVRLSSISLQYDTTQYTNQDGETFFIPLEAGLYDLEVSADDFSGITTTIFISDNTTQTIQLERLE